MVGFKGTSSKSMWNMKAPGSEIWWRLISHICLKHCFFSWFWKWHTEVVYSVMFALRKNPSFPEMALTYSNCLASDVFWNLHALYNWTFSIVLIDQWIQNNCYVAELALSCFFTCYKRTEYQIAKGPCFWRLVQWIYFWGIVG